MKKLKITTQKLTFEEGCNKYLEYCRQRNLRQGTINHYRQSDTIRHADLQMSRDQLQLSNAIFSIIK